MIPSFNLFASKYVRSVLPYLIVPSALLSSGLIRNVVDITILQFIIGFSTVGASITIGLLRDEWGFWFYAFYSHKIAMPVNSTLVNTEDTKKNKYIKTSKGFWPKFFYHPFYASVLTVLFVVLMSFSLFSFFKKHTEELILLCGIVILPLFLGWMLWKSLHYRWDIFCSFERKNHNKKKRIFNFLLCDLIISLSVNFSVVLPIEYKPAFSLLWGYENPGFIIAFIILMLCVLVFILFFAIRYRRYSMVGELLCGDISHNFAHGMPKVISWFLHTVWRFPVYIVFVIFWSIGICLFFDWLDIEPVFLPLYFSAMLPLAIIYLFERYQVIYDSFMEAQDIYFRLISTGIIKAN